MAKVHPLPPVVPKVSSKRKSFTIWMKSLVMQANGCTVYNENGEIVYRVDNYEKKGSNEVYLMDLRGKVLYTILRRGHVNAEAGCYTLEALAGVVLGEDVLSLVVEPHVDHSLMMALVTVYGLMHYRL
ncbi:hypothetical protein Pint_15174 [Pistacia integerrima]|uniref:Uncharacterized protein n=1 Tax=Pistacia integerrima TaxID=434235 RepID=A0ACC0ZBS3_9ROSI|nr:hypothetical protein Pint_15174 [Pistacia integerrima]